MPLTATFDPGHNHYPNENVYFFMNDRDRRVRCGVSELALEVFDPQGRPAVGIQQISAPHRKRCECEV